MPSPTGSAPFYNLGTLRGDQNILALLGATKWGGSLGTGVTLSYSFPYSGTNTAYFASNYAHGDHNNSFGLSQTEQTFVRQALKTVSMYANVKFVEVSDGASSVGTMRFTKGQFGSGEAAHAYLPGRDAWHGDVWLNANASETADLSPGSTGYGAVLHEIGHALGLKHPFEGTVRLPQSLDNKDNTIMSYSSGYFTGFSPVSPMPFDVIALQALYGKNTSFNKGNTVYTDATLQSMFGGSGRYDPQNELEVTVWDADGIDTFVAAGSRIDLRPGEPDYFRNGTYTRFTRYEAVIAQGVVIENATALEVGTEIWGNSANNVLKGASGYTPYFGYTGATIFGLGGNDTLHADRAIPQGGKNEVERPGFLYGGTGNDTLFGYQNHDVLEGESGHDRLYAGSNDDFLRGGSGNDWLQPGSGRDEVDGGSGIDIVDFGDHDRPVFLVLNGAQRRDVFINGVATDTVVNVEGVVGGTAADTLRGDNRSNTLSGNRGNDDLIGEAGNDVLDGGAGRDALFGGSGSDTASYASARAGVSASLSGGLRRGDAQGDSYSSIENLTGSRYADVLVGDSKSNVLRGGLGHDVLTGGGGKDTFVFDTRPGTSNRDHITVFSPVDDTIGLDNAIFRGLSGKSLASSQFKDITAPSAKLDPNDRILYDHDTGKLFFDADGSGSGARALFAILDNDPLLSARDFLIV